MMIDRYDPAELQEAFGIEMRAVDGLGGGASWGRVPPGSRTESHHHDETETFVIVAGHGAIVAGAGVRHPVGPGTVARFEPFESHVLENTGTDDLVFLTQYGRDPERALAAASARVGVGERPVFVFSTPPTPNGDLHLGHLSGPYLGADAYVRFQRMNGVRAWHLSGSDDFQSYVPSAARREGTTPDRIAARFSAEIAETLRLMDIAPDRYTATSTSPGYADDLRRYFSRLVDSGAVTWQDTAALLDGAGGGYLYEADVSGGCPHCGAATGGNICEECGEPNEVVDLVNPRSALSDEPPRRATVPRFTLSLGKLLDDVREHHREGRVPARLRELAHRLGMRKDLDIAVSHPSEWGIPPTDHEAADQVIWVWPEMSFGFLHGVERLGRELGEDWSALEPREEWKIVHFFGYDNSFYHAVLYPALYRLAFPEWRPDIDYHVNEFYLLEGAKFSTSRRHAIWGKEILRPGSVDAVRFFLSSTRAEGERTDFRREAFDAVVSEQLVGTWQAWLNDLGSRVDRRHGGHAPDAGNWTPEHTAFLALLGSRLADLTVALGPDGFSLRRAAEGLQRLVTDTVHFGGAQRPISDDAEWRDDDRTTIALELAAARLLATVAFPVMPRFAASLRAALELPPPERWPDTVELLRPGSAVRLAAAEFFRLDAD
ncbi:class I tRNA ligase family protein [Streptomyces profundus]|uniref:class I tRNA ligase family protein n=1 Tax=Streptomyces profundus TaxID=2867410 RepID=UPI001D16E9FE|nr:class I tRNA ligase family protein [Streptomyces sp. MA3_2.13]UED86554.1 class I tRNA ligase family protein [Streptomyces sp. MA3_2.13]